MSLVTTHVPINQVAGLITQEKLENHIRKIAYYSETLLSKKLHNIIFHVLALNPHAGEAGLLGCEEQEVIIPVLNSLRKNNLNLKGPFSPDGYFAYFNNLEVKPDILIAMYHDQGLIPYKLLSSGNAVNVTLGLRIPRTSPAHGTADDLVGKNIASPLSTINAVITAAKLISG
jgi:4-hydroxythreonine-4-phosphate dehydrogenase